MHSFHPEIAKCPFSCAGQWPTPSLASSHRPGPQHIPSIPFQERAGTQPEGLSNPSSCWQVSPPSLRGSRSTLTVIYSCSSIAKGKENYTQEPACKPGVSKALSGVSVGPQNDVVLSKHVATFFTMISTPDHCEKAILSGTLKLDLPRVTHHRCIHAQDISGDLLR